MLRVALKSDRFYRFVRWCGLALSLVLAAGLSGFVAMRYAIRGTVVVLPDLAGQTLADAGDSLRRMGLRVRVLGTKSEPGKPANVILSQDPVEGTPVKPNQTVRVIVTSVERRASVPNVVGSSPRVAQMTLLRSGHLLGEVCRLHFGPEGLAEVIAQIPSPDDTAVAGDPVHLLVNIGSTPEAYVMPDMVGRDINDAIQLFERSPIRIDSVSYRQSDESVKGVVLAQLPERGHRIDPQKPVRLEVSR